MAVSISPTAERSNATALEIALEIRKLLYAPGRPIGRQHRIKLMLEQLILVLEKEQPKGDTQC